MTADEEFLKLARELGTLSPEHEDEEFIVITFLTFCREIERRALERARDRFQRIIEEPKNTMSDAKALREILRQAELGLAGA